MAGVSSSRRSHCCHAVEGDRVKSVAGSNVMLNRITTTDAYAHTARVARRPPTLDNENGRQRGLPPPIP